MTTDTELRNPRVIADWADALIHEVQHALDRVDETLTFTEAKMALIRRERARRHSFGDEQHPEDHTGSS